MEGGTNTMALHPGYMIAVLSLLQCGSTYDGESIIPGREKVGLDQCPTYLQGLSLSCAVVYFGTSCM